MYVVCYSHAPTVSSFCIDMSSEIRLVQEIEKYECLYNSSLPEYNRKDLTEEAWAQVSYSTDLSVAECKEKWRNIRSSLLRNLKPSEKSKKPYYLMPFLHFVIPFLKPINNPEAKDELNLLRTTTKEPDIYLCTVKSEDECQLMCDTQSFINTTVMSDDETQSDPLLSQSISLPQKRRNRESTYSVANKRVAQKEIYTELNSSMSTIEPPRTSNESTRYFLLSLLPELETMSEEQIRQFKIKTMMAIDNIKSNVDKETANFQLHAERLQKKLNNLLIKNLAKN
ncbi:unnamed protein product [Danaus chrysippus]|uniref:(African queen) hypothetical protein n=1 Tax=Danaus chrysippus TaxID=151541 RepID=A0A8J2QHU2_9NEOP|nr:unnamed protein product [Danaus chrysippus]